MRRATIPTQKEEDILRQDHTYKQRKKIFGSKTQTDEMFSFRLGSILMLMRARAIHFIKFCTCTIGLKIIQKFVFRAAGGNGGNLFKQRFNFEHLNFWRNILNQTSNFVHDNAQVGPGNFDSTVNVKAIIEYSPWFASTFVQFNLEFLYRPFSACFSSFLNSLHMELFSSRR